MRGDDRRSVAVMDLRVNSRSIWLMGAVGDVGELWAFGRST